MGGWETAVQTGSVGGVMPDRDSKRRIVYLKDDPAARSPGAKCPSISCPGHCACVSKTK